MKEYPMRREGTHLVPVDEMTADEIRNLPSSSILMVQARSRRNPKQHRLAWALAEKVSEACDWLHDRDDAMDYLKKKTHHVRVVVDPDGTAHIFPKSIAWASLTQAPFNRLFNRMIWVVCNEVVPGMDEGKLRAEIMEMVGT